MATRDTRNNYRILVLALASILSPIAFILPADAAVPPNDERANPIILSDPLPITATGDSSEATAQDPTDPFGVCSGTQWQYTVWYQYTPTDSTIAFDISSDYGAAAAFFRVTDTGDLVEVACAGNATTIDLSVGQTYLIMIGACCAGPLHGGMFNISLSTAPPALDIQPTVDTASYDPRTGVTHLTGTHTCNTTTVNFFELSGTIRQLDKKTNTPMEDAFNVSDAGPCTSTTTTWSATVAGEHAYSLTSLFVTLQAVGCAQFTCDETTVTKSLKLRKHK